MNTKIKIKNLFNLEGKIALVTGASKGIGESMARGLAEFGAKVVVSSRKQEAVDEVANRFNSEGMEAVAISANMGSMDDISELIEQTEKIYGGIDILINNAATNPVFGPIQNTDQRAFDKIIDVNLRGPFEISKRVHPIMQRRGGGSIINIASIGGLKPEAGIGVYSATKAAIINLTQVMAQDWGADNIRVNAICPGLIKTKFSQALWSDEKNLNRFLGRIPLGRAGAPDDIAGMAVFLASDASAYCTGGIFLVDGGYSAT